jgi:hypothetical protein
MDTMDKHSRASARRSIVGRFIVAALGAIAWGSIVQTQINIADLQSIGVDLSFAQRISITAADLYGFTPIYAVIVLAALLCAFPIAARITRGSTRSATAWYACAGMAAIAAAIRLVDAATPPPTLIAATRGVGGWLLMAAGGALAGWYFARRRRRG